MGNEGKMRSTKAIQIWDAIHSVVCWWNETPVKGGALDLDGLEKMMVKASGESIEHSFTYSEVKAMLEDMRAWIDPDDGEEGNMWATRAKLYGINLDPA